MTIAAAASLEALIRIEVVHVRSFRGIDDVVLPLHRDLTVLVGRNNSGKSRLLRAIALACGDVRADRDDFTLGPSRAGIMDPSIDLVLAPATGDSFDGRVLEIFGSPQLAPLGERVAWRTTVRPSAEGWGARAERRFLTYDVAANHWVAASGSAELSRTHIRAVAADLTPTGRNLSDEATRPGSSLRRVLEDLEVDEAQRSTLESELADLGGRIVAGSSSLAAIRKRLDDLTATVLGIGTPDVSALPGRLEELVRLIEIALDTGNGPLPMRLHGSGAQSLASLQVQSVLYDRRLGRDGSDFPVLPVTLVEEPESHLHPQASLDVGDLLQSIPGQVVVSTHSSHLVTTVGPSSIRLVRDQAGTCVLRDLTPTDDAFTTPRALRLSLAASEWEKIRRLVERPFGEVLFASAVVIGDGSTERGFLPHVLRAAVGPRAGGICVVDPGSMAMAAPIVKYAEAADIPCILFVDCDAKGRKDAAGMPAYATRVWATGDETTDGALESVLVAHDGTWVVEQCDELSPSSTGNALTRLTSLKGSFGNALGRAFVQRWPDPVDWPPGLQQLVAEFAAMADDASAAGDANAGEP